MYRSGPFRFLSVLTLALALGACSAEVEEEGSLPDVDVQGGEMPDVDIDPANVNVNMDTQTVVVPDIDVNATGSEAPDTTSR